ncbi:MAG: PrsW family intramembrane metalloprotease [Bacteroidota bacterium]|nr:PrsW family intramembrane metalloprotease [Candidatus Kapabacteria bacterium]MDW8219513.1 PrsW family intramembrane metalloprotease [Bacteroidota bacterium]
MGYKILLAFPLAIIPMLLFIYVVRRLDKYDPEPLWLVTFHFLWGALIAVSGAALINGQIQEWLGVTGLSLTDAPAEQRTILLVSVALLGPIVEELLKASVFSITTNLREFNNLTDGIVYGSTVGFGFAMSENLIYFIEHAAADEGWIQLVLYRTFFSATMHALSSSVFAAFLGYGRWQYGDIPKRMALYGIIPAIVLHIGWNYFVTSTSYTVNVFGFLFVIAAFIGMCVAFARSMRYEYIRIRTELEQEAQIGTIPEAYIDLPFREHRSADEYLIALLCSQIAFERITNRQLRTPHQIERSNKILEALRNKIKSMPPLPRT